MPTSFMPKLRVAALLAAALVAPQRLSAAFAPVIEPGGVQWQPGPGAPEATRAGDGIKFQCPFNAQSARFYWDRPVSADLAKSATLELDLTSPGPETVQSIGLYLKSGNGWYLWIRPFVKAGRQKFFLQVKDAATEGNPSGWNKINGVRVSFQGSPNASASITLHRLGAGSSSIILVKGTSSAPDDGERKVAEKTTSRLSKWLEDAGAEHSVLTDDDIANGRVRAAAVIVLPYNPHLGDTEMRQLEKLSAAGSKLIVFYGSNPRLADLMGFKLGKYQAAGLPGRWSSFVFNRDAPAGIPPKIIQESGNIFTVFPDAKNSKIIAYWQDAGGNTLADPAWAQSDAGAWMTHILQGEDSDHKKKMLLALIGQYAPQILKEANARAEPPAAAIGALTQRIGACAFRGVWNHSGLGLYPGNWDKTCQTLARSGITAVFPNLLWPGSAHYPSKCVPRSEQAARFGDQAAQCVSAARKAGLEVHVWKVCWHIPGGASGFNENMRKQNRLQRDKKGEIVSWLCPSDQANIAIELSALREILSAYDIDGIHLDYVRYPDANSCFCQGCRGRFEKWSGAPVASWPADALSGARSGQYREWRALQMTGFVRLVRAEMKKIKPGAKLSAAVYPKYPECIQSIGQDWGLWLREGAVDFVCPMNYFPSVPVFRENLSRQVAIRNSGRRIYPGIGVTLSGGDLAAEVFLGQIDAAAQLGAGGFVLFDLNPSLAANFLPFIGAPAR